jgi:hypothetical protein
MPKSRNGHKQYKSAKQITERELAYYKRSGGGSVSEDLKSGKIDDIFSGLSQEAKLIGDSEHPKAKDYHHHDE